MKGIVANRDAHIESLQIPKYVEQLLALHGIRTVRDLESWTDIEILALDGFDVKGLAKLKYALARDGYNLGGPPDDDASCYRFEDPWNPKPRKEPFTKRWEDFLPPLSRQKTSKLLQREGTMLTLAKKPTRKDLLAVITELQNLVGTAMSAHANDRDPAGFEKGQKALEQAHELCILARSYDPPIDHEDRP